MDTKIVFNQKWIEEAVRNLFQKKEEDILNSDIEKIKYLQIGEGYDNEFIIEMGLNTPPTPFVDTEGGDEWGDACIESNDIPRFLDENKGNENIQLSLFNFDYEENKEYVEYVSSDEACEKWEEFGESIFQKITVKT